MNIPLEVNGTKVNVSIVQPQDENKMRVNMILV